MDSHHLITNVPSFARTARYGKNEFIRRQGHHYDFAILILDGSAEVHVNNKRKQRQTIEVGPGQPIGEIGFLFGNAATADVIARTDIEALIVDDHLLTQIENERSDFSLQLVRALAQTAERRLAENAQISYGGNGWNQPTQLEVKLCRTDALLHQAQSLRYDIYCRELQRRSPYADQATCRISDPLDGFGHTFLASDGDENIGSIRTNFARDGDLGLLEDIYKMPKSQFYPDNLGIVTKFVVRRKYRGSSISLKLIAAATRFGLRHDMHECYIDTVPQLEPYYIAMGFDVCGENFLHRENGPSVPMRINLIKYGKRLTREPTRLTMVGVFIKAALQKRIKNIRYKIANRGG